jgi:hypothetical protein
MHLRLNARRARKQAGKKGGSCIAIKLDKIKTILKWVKRPNSVTVLIFVDEFLCFYFLSLPFNFY